MRQYEMMAIVRADLSDTDMSAQLETIKGWVETAGGSVVETNHWGRRRMAYPIEKQRDGFYALYKLELPAEAPTEIERLMRLSENMLRFLLTNIWVCPYNLLILFVTPNTKTFYFVFSTHCLTYITLFDNGICNLIGAIHCPVNITT